MKPEIKQFITLNIITAIALLLVIALFGDAEAQQSHVWHSEIFGTLKIKKGAGDLDGWSMGHLGGGMAIYYITRKAPTLVGLEVGPKKALVFTICTSVIYELLIDGFGNKMPFSSLVGGDNSQLPDPRGADFKGDVMFAAVGGVLACTLDLLFRLDDKKYKLIVQSKQVGVIVGF